MTRDSKNPEAADAPKTPATTLVEEPVTKAPDVPGDKPASYKFVDWAAI